ncbi:MAG TPA: hypothetical protein VNO21_08485 [Polyangiaceae bacterium]|nr:hypothetical protein [Polyangiaceae bacterium]
MPKSKAQKTPKKPATLSRSSSPKKATLARTRAKAAPKNATLELPSGRKLAVQPDPEGERLSIHGKGGKLELSIVLTDAGPRLVIDAADIELRAQGTLAVDCERFEVRARTEASIRAPDAVVEATKGSLDLRANDFVRVVGEQIRLNCDRPEEIPAWMKEALEARFLHAPPPQTTHPAAEVTGDGDLLAEFDRLALSHMQRTPPE